MSNASRLLVVDDDQDLRDTLAEQLALYDEFQVATVETAGAAIQAVKSDRVDLAIMDVGLPDMDGREAVKAMRRGGFRSPIIMLTAQGLRADTVLGWNRAPTTTSQAVQVRGAPRPHPGAAAPVRGQRGRGVPDRPLHLPARGPSSSPPRRARS
jgi:CheY-like chemotaxis protein